MASAAGDATEQVITFDISDDSIMSGDFFLDGNLTQEEKEEMVALVDQIDGVNSRELIDFTLQEFAAPAKPWHKVITSDELDRLAAKNMAENTLYQTKWSVTVLREWLRENQMSQNFEDLDVEDLAELLRQFYGTVLSKTGKEYSRSGFINLRSGINRHLQANLVLTGRLRDNKDKGLDVSAPRTSIGKDDIECLFKQYFTQCIGDKMNTEVLLHKFFWDIMYYTGRR